MEQHNSDGITIAISAGSSSAPTTEMKEEENFLMPPPLPNTTPPPPISTYSVPFWDAKPIHKFQLEVLKTGSIVETRDIYNKGHFLFGRLPHCDIQLEHQSISRQHAILQHRDNGSVYLYDLGSTHGTRVNKIPLKPRTYQQLHVGDQLRFGESSRIYILCGPEELKPPEAQPNRPSPPTSVPQQLKVKPKEVQEAAPESISWGTLMSEAEETEDPTEKEVAERQKQLQEYLEKVDAYYSDDDISFYDKTKKKPKKKETTVQPKTETAESLQKKKALLDAQHRDLLVELDLIPKDTQSSEGDALDSFMTGLSGHLNEEKRRKLQEKISELEIEIDRVGKLVNLSQPALAGLKRKAETLDTPQPTKFTSDQRPASNLKPNSREQTQEQKVPTPMRTLPPPGISETPPVSAIDEQQQQQQQQQGKAKKISKKHKNSSHQPEQPKYDDEIDYVDAVAFLHSTQTNSTSLITK